MIDLEVTLTGESAFAKLEGVSDKVRNRFAELLKPVEERMLDDARANALDHFHTVGAEPGLYLAAFSGGVKSDKGGVVGWVRNANPLAHLLEDGFTISDFDIVAKTGVMAFFEEGVGELFRRAVHRHETAVKPYPAIAPAFDAHKAEVAEAAKQAVK